MTDGTTVNSELETVEAWDAEREANVSFRGRHIAFVEHGTETWNVYQTGRGRIAVVYDGRDGHVEDHDTFADFAEAWTRMPGLVAQVANGLGIDYTVELDI